MPQRALSSRSRWVSGPGRRNSAPLRRRDGRLHGPAALELNEGRALGLPSCQQPRVPPEVVGPMPAIAALAFRAKRPGQRVDDMPAPRHAGIGNLGWPERQQPLELGASDRGRERGAVAVTRGVVPNAQWSRWPPVFRAWLVACLVHAQSMSRADSAGIRRPQKISIG
jgi:hypothetical protein